MRKTLVTGFSDFLTEESNSTEQFLREIPASKQLIKKILPVGYFRRSFLRPIKKYQPKRIIFLGMDASKQKPTIETIAKNKKITLRKKWLRWIVTIYSYYLKWRRRNLRLKKPIPKKKLIIVPIKKKQPKTIPLSKNFPQFKHIQVSTNAGHYVCNYAMWVVAEYLKKKKSKTEFYFIHLPKKITKSQKEELKKFILEK